jgi:UDP-N-acetylglucosamine 2-epimerase (non-hydrolysing)
MPHGVSPSAARPLFWPTLVHTGQHYDPGMSDVFFRELDLPEPHHHLGCGSGSHAEQTAAVMRGFERILLDGDLRAVPGRSPDGLPDLVLVVGDVNSTLAAALVCAKLHVPVAHVEAGLRSRDWSMPEEVNRILTDHCCQLLFTTSRDADENLRAEGIAADRVRFVGNTMIESLDRVRASAAYGSSDVLRRLALDPRGYCVATLHRPSNVDAEDDLRRVLAVLAELARHVPVVYPVHPRARARVSHLRDPSSQAAGSGAAGAAPSIRLIDPLGHLDFLALLEHARLVVTDSGGVQEETTVLGVPCLTARETTERPITITQGTNRLIPPSDLDGMLAAVREVLAATEPATISSSEPTFGYTPRRPELWDGRAGERIVGEIAVWLASR